MPSPATPKAGSASSHETSWRRTGEHGGEAEGRDREPEADELARRPSRGPVGLDPGAARPCDGRRGERDASLRGRQPAPLDEGQRDERIDREEGEGQDPAKQDRGREDRAGDERAGGCQSA